MPLNHPVPDSALKLMDGVYCVLVAFFFNGVCANVVSVPVSESTTAKEYENADLFVHLGR